MPVRFTSPKPILNAPNPSPQKHTVGERSVVNQQPDGPVRDIVDQITHGGRDTRITSKPVGRSIREWIPNEREKAREGNPQPGALLLRGEFGHSLLFHRGTERCKAPLRKGNPTLPPGLSGALRFRE